MGVILIFLSWLVSCHGQFVDELQGYEKTCLGEDKFLCLDGSCIPQEKYCDGHINCADASDESFCPEHPADPAYCNSTSHFLCADNKKCIPNPWLCNKMLDCDDGSDEVNCTMVVSTERPENVSCKGFVCDKTKCISNLWTCDGFYDCDDKTDEAQEQCRFSHREHLEYTSMYQCLGIHLRPDAPVQKHYRCIDSSFCLPQSMMCDGMVECRDGSDEGEFCKNWHTICSSNPCPSKTQCEPDRFGLGYTCVCPNMSMQKYNATTNSCEDVDECASPMPYCSQICHNYPSGFKCECEDGYTMGDTRILCHALGPEAMIFFSTKNEIGYISVKSKNIVTVAKGIKQGHGVAYDGKYVYWVESAQGHQAIMRAQFDNVEETTEVLVGLGLEDPGDVSVDWLRGHIYFTDSERSIISVCKTDGSICTTLPTLAKSPRFVTLDVRNGQMYWADFFSRPVIMSAGMDGSHSQVLVDSLSAFATSLTVDAPSGRLYYVDHNSIQAVKLDTKQHYPVFEYPFHHPYAVAVFENTVYWSDWVSRSIQTLEKVMGNGETRRQLVTIHNPVFDMHIYHPVLMAKTHNPCSNHTCSHLCLVSSSTTYTCACPDGMNLKYDTCQHIDGFRPQYLVVGAGSAFSRVQYNSLGNPETHATYLNIGRVQAMAYDSVRDTLYVYDGDRQAISGINMSDFTLGITHPFVQGLVSVVEMDYDYASDSLYILDAGKPSVEVVSLRTHQRAMVYRFRNMEIPISFCVMPEYGKMLVAIRENEYNPDIYIESIGLDGSGRKRIVSSDLSGPRVRVRYAHNMDNVYLADEGNNIIEYMSPEGSGREHFRDPITSIAGLSVTDAYVFWTDRRTPRLFWAGVNDVTNRIRRIQFSIFPNNTQLYIQASSPPPSPNSTLMSHPCLTKNTCSHVCVQTPHMHPPKAFKPFQMGYKCLCPPSLLPVNGNCTKLVTCNFEQEFYCHDSNKCVLKSKKCDGRKDCDFGEDEEDCERYLPTFEPGPCPKDNVLCNGKCMHKSLICMPIGPATSICEPDQFRCNNSNICIERSQVCDKVVDCPFSSDEDPSLCHTYTCDDSEFMCTMGSCVWGQFRCDGEEDCPDGSDEADCEKHTCTAEQFQCKNKQCIDLSHRCDGVEHCADHSDEKFCVEPVTEKDEDILPQCADKEFHCELNTSICLPNTARCNKKADCPGGTDEFNCDDICAPRGQFLCKQQLKCVPKQKVCDGFRHCNDGSDEEPEACAMANRTSFLYPSLFPAYECHGYLCNNGECVEWARVCDGLADCIDKSDEGGNCAEACKHHSCEYTCQPTPTSQHCACARGMTLHADRSSCVDIDECTADICSQYCYNVPGSFLCSCYHGYSLRLDRRSCKATQGTMSVLWVSGNTVLSSTEPNGIPSLVYHDKNVSRIVDIDTDVRRNKTFVSLPYAKKLVELNEDGKEMFVTNIGTPTRVAVDWITGNIYFVDLDPSVPRIRVCNVEMKKCAILQKLPLTRGAKLTALVVDPGSRRMFYCVTRDGESVVYSASLAGRQVVDLATRGNCTGLAVNSFGRQLYVAETGPAQIVRMDFDGDKHDNVVYGQPHLDAPRGLAIFEDWIYYLVANSQKLSRCRLYSKKTCEPYDRSMSGATTFVIRHSSVQRDDLVNVCDGYACSNLCVLGVNGPQCLCENGSLSINGNCGEVEESSLPLFNGTPHWHRKESSYPTVITVVCVLVLLAIAVAFYFWFREYKWKIGHVYPNVHFRNTPHDDFEDDTTMSEAPPPPNPDGEFRHVLNAPLAVPPVDPEVGIPHNPVLRLQNASDEDSPSGTDAGITDVPSTSSADVDGNVFVNPFEHEKKSNQQDRADTESNRGQRDSAQGVNAQGDSAQGDSAQGDSAQGVNAQGDSAQGDSAQGVTTQGVTAQGDRVQVDIAQGDSAQGVTAQRDTAHGDSAGTVT